MNKNLSKEIRASITIISLMLASEVMADDTKEKYHAAVVDAAFAEAGEITDQLLAITKDNDKLVWNEDKSKLLVATWKAQGSYDRFIKPYDKTSDNPEYAVWVTVVPQVKDMCGQYAAEKNNTGKAQLDERLKQYLGLDPSWQYDVFVEMWVNPDDLFRPCVDPETDDTTCNLEFGEQTPQVRNIPDYRDFYRNLYFKSFRGSAGVPWTGLGYTFDWADKRNEIGASEFILRPGAGYEIKDATPTEDYCKQSLESF
ncbi:MAG: hypothetical protein ACU84J_12130 [Gammaproteobacteria bacterium]